MLAEHQRDAVVRALELLASRGGLLLADDVGLGKSLVAADVIRRLGCAAELIVPAALVEQWRELETGARILTHDGIAGDPFVPQPGNRLVVVDEAHAFRNPRTQRYAALARRTIGARVLLVTATPVCNSVADLEALMRLVAADDRLADVGIPSIDRAFETGDREMIERIVAALVIRRDRSVLIPELQFGRLDRRVVRHAVPDIRTLDALRFPLVGDHAILRRFLWRRLESSEAALTESVRRQLRFYDRALSCLASGRPLPKRDYRRAFAHEEDRDAFQQVLFWELFSPAEGEIDPASVREEVERLEAILKQLAASPCEKRSMMVALARDEPEPMLIFTGSAATARDLHEAVGAVRRCGLVTSREPTRDAVLRAFRLGQLDVVVSTDMAAEGLNLQRAGVVVHYDIPWNPVRLDQRNGRAYRIGQTRPTVQAIYFLPQSRETRIVETVARKNRVRRQLLNASPSADPTSRQPTLRPRLTRTAAYLGFARAARAFELPESLARRHKAGLEQLLFEMSREFLDQRRLDELLALVDR